MNVRTTTPNQFNYQEVLERVAKAKQVWVATYGIGTSNQNPLLQELKRMDPNSHVTFVTSIPNRVMTTNPSVDCDATTKFLLGALEPSSFPCAVDSWFCFDNHAKVLIVDDVAYIGSANFSHGSSKNFEAGYIVTNPEEVVVLRDFFELLKTSSVPHSVIQGQKERRLLLAFAASIPSYTSALEDLVCDWKADYSGDGEYVVNPDQFALPNRLSEEVAKASAAIEGLETSPAFSQEGHKALESVSQHLSDLHNLCETIQAGSALPKMPSSNRMQSLAQDLLYLSNDGKVDERVSQAVTEAFADEFTKALNERAAIATRLYGEINTLFANIRHHIPTLLMKFEVNPQVLSTKKKYD